MSRKLFEENYHKIKQILPDITTPLAYQYGAVHFYEGNGLILLMSQIAESAQKELGRCMMNLYSMKGCIIKKELDVDIVLRHDLGLAFEKEKKKVDGDQETNKNTNFSNFLKSVIRTGVQIKGVEKSYAETNYQLLLKIAKNINKPGYYSNTKKQSNYDNKVRVGLKQFEPSHVDSAITNDPNNELYQLYVTKIKDDRTEDHVLYSEIIVNNKDQTVKLFEIDSSVNELIKTESMLTIWLNYFIKEGFELY